MNADNNSAIFENIKYTISELDKGYFLYSMSYIYNSLIPRLKENSYYSDLYLNGDTLYNKYFDIFLYDRTNMDVVILTEGYGDYLIVVFRKIPNANIKYNLDINSYYDVKYADSIKQWEDNLSFIHNNDIYVFKVNRKDMDNNYIDYSAIREDITKMSDIDERQLDEIIGSIEKNINYHNTGEFIDKVEKSMDSYIGVILDNVESSNMLSNIITHITSSFNGNNKHSYSEYIECEGIAECSFDMSISEEFRLIISEMLNF